MKKFFAAANTENGFLSLFDEIFAPEKFRRIYILKGGPGTGKSTLMQKIGSVAQTKGYDVEYICCSSDPDSLDGVIISELAVAILDGTAPHMTDPIYPGAVERIVDLGVAFDFHLLEEKRNELIPLIREKRASYRTAYRFLSAVGKIEREHDALLRNFYLREKAEAAAKRLVAPLLGSQRKEEKKRYISAICGKGVCHLDTLYEQAEKVYAITDQNGLGYLFMDTLYARLRSEGFSLILCPSPVSGERKEAIFLNEGRVLFAVIGGKDTLLADKTVNSARFVDKEQLAQKRRSLRFMEKCESSLLDGAMACFAQAGEYHAKAERIYGACVDFSKVDAVFDKIIDEIFENNV